MVGVERLAVHPHGEKGPVPLLSREDPAGAWHRRRDCARLVVEAGERTRTWPVDGRDAFEHGASESRPSRPRSSARSSPGRCCRRIRSDTRPNVSGHRLDRRANRTRGSLRDPPADRDGPRRSAEGSDGRPRRSERKTCSVGVISGRIAERSEVRKRDARRDRCRGAG